MIQYEVKKVIPVESSLSFEEAEKILVSDQFCFGILNSNQEIHSFVTFEDFSKAIKFNIKHKSINLIAVDADTIDMDINNLEEFRLKRYIKPGLNKGVFVGKSKKKASHLIVVKFPQIQTNLRSIIDKYEKNIPADVKKALNFCCNAADKISLPIYLVGGVVRDIIIDEKIIDIDITVEGNAIEFSKHLRKEYSDICKIKELHEDFKTAKVTFSISGRNIELDIASTRKESYQYPAALPSVEEIGTSILDDLIRRDFTINAMALSLNKSTFCQLIDPFGGYDDLSHKKIKVLHPISFIDDPTRMIRALKFCIRFSYRLESNSKALQEVCIVNHLFDNLAGERIKSEIKQTFNINQAECLSRFIKEKIYTLVNKDIPIPQSPLILSRKVQDTITKYCNYLGSQDLIWLIYLGTLIMNLSLDEIIQLSGKLYLSGLETEVLIGGKNIINKANNIKSVKTRFEIYEQLEGYFTESILIGLINAPDKAVSSGIELYLKELYDIKIYTTGKTLIEAGLVPGPIFGEVLRELLQAKVNQKISSKEDEIKYLRTLVTKECSN